MCLNDDREEAKREWTHETSSVVTKHFFFWTERARTQQGHAIRSLTV